MASVDCFCVMILPLCFHPWLLLIFHAEWSTTLCLYSIAINTQKHLDFRGGTVQHLHATLEVHCSNILHHGNPLFIAAIILGKA